MHPKFAVSIGRRFLAFLVAGCSALTLTAGDWPNWRGPNHDGVSRETGWQPAFSAAGPKALWQRSVHNGFSSVAVSNGRLYTMGNQNNLETVFCFDAETGREIWTHTYPCPIGDEQYEGGPNSTPTVHGNRVYTLSRQGHVFCLEADSGKVVWSKNIAEELGLEIANWGFSGSVLVEGDLLILNAGTAGTALRRDDGQVAWSNGTQATGFATPVALDWRGERRVLIFGAKALYMVDVKDGRQVWRHPWETMYDINAADPIVRGDRIFISSAYNHGGAVLQLTGGAPRELWKNSNLGTQLSPAVLVGDHLYGFNGNSGRNATLRCVDFNTGEVRWIEPMGYGTVKAADDKLIVLSERGELSVAQATPEAFKPVSRAHVTGGRCWTVPVLANGRLYTRNARGDLVCFDLR